MIPLGLYRTVKVNLKAFKKDSSNSRARKTKVVNVNGEQPVPDYDEVYKWIHYVITNPDKDTRLEKSDLIFVLARSDPGDPETWDDYDNQNQDVFQMINKNGMINKGKNTKESIGKDGANSQGADAPGAKKGGTGSSNNAFY